MLDLIDAIGRLLLNDSRLAASVMKAGIVCGRTIARHREFA